jgi:hypothetical protein
MTKYTIKALSPVEVGKWLLLFRRLVGPMPEVGLIMLEQLLAAGLGAHKIAR